MRYPSIYIAAPYADRTGAATQAKVLLEQRGFPVTASWIDRDEDDTDPEVLIRAAQRDLEDIFTSHLFVLINTQPRGQETSGKAVETGIALTLGLPILAVGEPTNIFHHLTHPTFFTWFPTIEALVEQVHVWMEEERLVMRGDRRDEESKLAGDITMVEGSSR